MTTTLQQESVSPESAMPTTAPKRAKKNTTALQFRCMMILAGGFFLEVLVYSIIPEDSSLSFLKGISVAVLSLIVTWCMFKYAVND
jgi:hypothetical protein